MNKKYVILEIIPTKREPERGKIAQLSALKLDGLKLIERFDYRLNLNEIDNEFILKMLDYDNDKFIYADNNKIVKNFKTFIGDLDLLIIDNSYTENYIKYYFKNKYESIFNYLNMKYHDDIIPEIIKKYHLEPSNYIVDLLYEALIYEEG